MGAPSFKDVVAADVGTFLNPLEFADTYKINGKDMTAMVDDTELLERGGGKMGIKLDGTYTARRLLYVAKREYGKRPAIGNQVTLNEKRYRVAGCTEEAGILAIELEATKT